MSVQGFFDFVAWCFRQALPKPPYQPRCSCLMRDGKPFDIIWIDEEK
jgi:hypothetical protein